MTPQGRFQAPGILKAKYYNLSFRESLFFESFSVESSRSVFDFISEVVCWRRSTSTPSLDVSQV